VALIEVEGLTKVYRMGDVEVHALRGVSLAIEEGEFVAIMGSSGSGKSTLMSILGGLDRPTSGTYRLDGVDVASLSRDALAHLRNQKIGFVFQSFQLLARTSAIENVELPLLYAKGVSSGARHRRAKEALARVSLQGREGHRPNQLSGGQQQRVAIARALVNEPSLLLADEPTGNLDSRVSAEIMALFQELSDAGNTVVFVTHEPDVAQYAKRRVVLKDGAIVTDEPVRDRTIARDLATAGAPAAGEGGDASPGASATEASS
jgi:putative ABC transport system ATP-binding protein